MTTTKPSNGSRTSLMDGRPLYAVISFFGGQWTIIHEPSETVTRDIRSGYGEMPVHDLPKGMPIIDLRNANDAVRMAISWPVDESPAYWRPGYDASSRLTKYIEALYAAGAKITYT